MTTRELHWRVAEKDITVRLDESKGHGTFHISGESIPFRVLDSSHIEISGKKRRFYVLQKSDSCTVWLDGRTYFLERTRKTGAAGDPSVAASGEIRAIMPGKLVRLEVRVGDAVTEKQTVAIMESMKMETPLQAPRSGRIVEIRCEPGQVVEMGEVLMVIE